MKQLVFATAIRHKLKEIQAMMPDEIQIKGLSEIGFTGDIPETEPTLEGNAMLKARFVHEKYQLPCFADDTGLEVEALNGAPGVFSARYAATEGSQEERAKANIDKLLRELDGKKNRKARFRTVIACIEADNKSYIFEGIVDGTITEEPIGDDGFGYDPIFKPDGCEATFAQMTLCEKNLISHRARAFSKFAEYNRNRQNPEK